MEDNYPLTAIMPEALKDSLTASTPEALKDPLIATTNEEIEDISSEQFEGFAQGYISRIIIDDHDTITNIHQDESCIILTTLNKKILFCKAHDDSYRFHCIYHIHISESDIINKNRDEIPCYVNVVILEKIENNILYFLHVDLDYEVETRVMVPYNS
jgi:hypothetical protein